MSAIGEAGFHGGVAVPVEQGDLIAGAGELIGRGDGGDAVTLIYASDRSHHDNGDIFAHLIMSS